MCPVPHGYNHRRAGYGRSPHRLHLRRQDPQRVNCPRRHTTQAYLRPLGTPARPQRPKGVSMHLNANRGSKRPQMQKAIQNQEGAPNPWTPPPWHPGPTLSATRAHHRTTQRSHPPSRRAPLADRQPRRSPPAHARPGGPAGPARRASTERPRMSCDVAQPIARCGWPAPPKHDRPDHHQPVHPIPTPNHNDDLELPWSRSSTT